ncbi:glycosyltransferase family 87 protein [Agromyces archimandritae]|uniref:DUF2029 domain-containing protein n=1 Tax=Agromyces archimandritae TaxID=2781962 RepID=A0A975FPD2_9MICO|nr:glycosyltransferase family 87 protein [Agromyces archimandritae]QTX05203.1 DUF2029 domain-containing protein [Agromyces archimandritae]
MSVGGTRSGRGRLGRAMSTAAALWIGFATVHAGLAALNLFAPGYPLGDVTGVYFVWAENAAHDWVRMGIDEPWVYPILAFAPMAASLALGPELYAWTWLGIVIALDAAVFAVLLGRGARSRPRRIAAWWWLAFLAALGPIALGRIDAITVPFAIAGLLWAAGRPRVAAALITIATWVKVWPAALGLALVTASRKRGEVVMVALALSAGIVGVSLLAGSELNVFGFIGEQTVRGLQVEAPLAVPWLWAIALGDTASRISYDHDILTFQIDGPGVEIAWITTPLMIAGVLAFLVLGIRAVRRGAAFGRVLPPLALGFVAWLMLANKVGSPQFVTWLAAPIVLGLVYRPHRFVLPASLALAVAAFTHVIYPYLYGWLLVADPGFVFLLTAKHALVAVIAVWCGTRLWQAGRRRPVDAALADTRGRIAA